MTSRSHLSIGEVLSLLQEEFPDVTISKIRFLESQGLVDPERTPSGYRKFYEADIERLRWVLRQQRDAFLPLKVIKGRLEGQADLLEGTDGQPPPPHARGFEDDPEAQVMAGFGYDQAPRPVLAVGAKQLGGDIPQSYDLSSQGLGEAVAGERSPVPTRLRDHARSEPVVVGGTALQAKGAMAEPERAPEVVSQSGRGLGPDSHNRDKRSQVSPGQAEGDPQDAVGQDQGQERKPGRVRGSDSRRRDNTGRDNTGRDNSSTMPRTSARGISGRPGAGNWGATEGSAPASGPVSDEGEELSLEELIEETGVSPGTVQDLERYGLVTARVVAGTSYYNREAATIVTVAAQYSHHGVEARHLRAFKAAADREAGLVQQVIMPLIRQRNPDARQAAADAIEDLCNLGGQLRSALIRRALSDLR